MIKRVKVRRNNKKKRHERRMRWKSEKHKMIKFKLERRILV